MNRLFGMVVLCLAASISCAQVASVSKALVADEPPPPNPCNTTPPTVGTCWDCFQNLLADCDAHNPEGARRQACYTGANNFFTFCLGRTTAPANPAPRKSSINESYNTLSGTSYSLLIGTLDYDQVIVYVRDMDAQGNPRQTQTTSFTAAFGSGELFVSVDAPFVINGNSAGIVTTFLKQGQIVAALADSMPVVNGLDLNADGAVNENDLIVAMQYLDEGKWTNDQFTAYLEAYGH